MIRRQSAFKKLKNEIGVAEVRSERGNDSERVRGGWKGSGRIADSSAKETEIDL